MPVLHANDRVDDFEIVRLLGKGGMGEVYEAKQLSLDRMVAVKVLAKWLCEDDDSLARFLREAQVPASLDHPNIVKIIAMGKTRDGVAYYVMHLVRGISLVELTRRGKTGPALADSNAPTRSLDGNNTPSNLPSSEAASPPAGVFGPCPPVLRDYVSNRFSSLARIGIQAAHALAWAHQQGHLHRDIKPSNIMVDQHDHVYLVDFGLTRGLTPGGSSTRAGLVIGTPWYMSPEQARAEPLDERSDVYSLGVTLYELATHGAGPWTANREDQDGTLVQVRAGQALPLRVAAPDIPAELEQIILRAMNLKPHKRFGSALELARALEGFLGVTPKHALRSRTPGQISRRRWPIWIGIALFLVTVLASSVAIISLAFTHRNKDDEPPGIAPLGKLDGANALPEYLQKQRLDVKVALMKGNHEPLWKEPLFGKGSYLIQPAQLMLVAQDRGLYVLGIADPDRHCFDFSIDAGRSYSADNDPEVNRLGIVFGWQRRAAESDVHPRFFIVEIDENARWMEEHGHARTGTGWVVLPTKNRASSKEWFTLLPGEKNSIALSSHPSFHTIHVKVRRDKATVSIGNGPGHEFSVPWLREIDARAATNLNPRGAIGIWTMKGYGSFRNASLTLIPDD